MSYQLLKAYVNDDNDLVGQIAFHDFQKNALALYNSCLESNDTQKYQEDMKCLRDMYSKDQVIKALRLDSSKKLKKLEYAPMGDFIVEIVEPKLNSCFKNYTGWRIFVSGIVTGIISSVIVALAVWIFSGQISQYIEEKIQQTLPKYNIEKPADGSI